MQEFDRITKKVSRKKECINLNSKGVDRTRKSKSKQGDSSLPITSESSVVSVEIKQNAIIRDNIFTG